MATDILITGAGGFVGQRLARLLAERGRDVVALVQRQPEGAVAARLQHPRIRVEVMDLERPDFARLPNDIEGVVALAQCAHFRDFPRRAGEIFAVNVAAHAALLEWARAIDVRRFVYASSGGVYGPLAPVPVAESHALSIDVPLGFYPGTKLCAEVLSQNYRHFFDTAVILRPFFIYGPGQRPDMLIPRLIESVRSGQAIKLQGRDGLRLNPIYVDDAVEGFAAALEANGHHVLNLGGPDVVTLRAIGELIGGLVGKALKFETTEGVPSDFVGDTTLARGILGAPRVGFPEGIAHTLQTDHSSP